MTKKILLTIGLFQLTLTTESSVKTIEIPTTTTTISKPTFMNILATKDIAYKSASAAVSALSLIAGVSAHFLASEKESYASWKGFLAAFIMPFSEGKLKDSNIIAQHQVTKKKANGEREEETSVNSKMWKAILLPLVMIAVLAVLLVLNFNKINKNPINIAAIAANFLPLLLNAAFAFMVMFQKQFNAENIDAKDGKTKAVVKGTFTTGAKLLLWASFVLTLISVVFSILQFVGQNMNEATETVSSDQDAE
jgi:hypothetical protein